MSFMVGKQKYFRYFKLKFSCIPFKVRIHSYVMDEVIRRKLFFTKILTATDTETQPHKLRKVYKALALSRRIVLNDFPDPELFHIKAKEVAAFPKANILDNLIAFTTLRTISNLF